MLMTLFLVAFLFPVTAPSAKPAVVLDIHIQMPDVHQSIAAGAPILLSMGPDPGGKTGATVNSDTTKTGQPSVDSAASPNSSSASNAGGAERGSAQSQGTASGSDSSKRGSSTGNSPSDSTDHSQNAPANLNPSATSR